jgi:hypothetical protein
VPTIQNLKIIDHLFRERLEESHVSELLTMVVQRPASLRIAVQVSQQLIRFNASTHQA